MKRGTLQRKTPLTAKRGFNVVKRNRVQMMPSTKNTLKRSRGKLGGNKSKSTKIKNRGYQVPSWFKSLKPGSHGATLAQKKYWRVVSETIRQEEFIQYGGRCVSCPRILLSWKDGQCGHYKAWSVCNGFFKYERKNLALICSHCNKISDGPINEAFKRELQRRHGESIIDWINTENQKYHNTKMELWEIVERTAKILNIPLSTDSN